MTDGMKHDLPFVQDARERVQDDAEAEGDNGNCSGD
jgi:hypothetical protein